jgi:hypothetical protein
MERKTVTVIEDKSSSQSPMKSETRRGTRVPLKVAVEVQGVNERLTCEGETIIVNVNGALIFTDIGLKVGMRIEIQVHLTGRRTEATVVYVDSEHPMQCGIALAKPENIWGLSLPPEDWFDDQKRP